VSPGEPDDFDPFEGEDLEDSWEPPREALGGPGQILAAVVGAFVAALVLLGAVAAVVWLLRQL
jgi:NAD(P)H-hydrate repair Nnr-like enzyme with NAD(P)H-hydrate dehydratase domain